MRFALSPEQRQFGASLRELLTAAGVPAITRSWSAEDYQPGRVLWRRLADAGVTALGTSEVQGGYGATAVDMVIGFEELGRAGAPGPFVESVAVLPALLTAADHGAELAALGQGTLMATVAMPPDVPYAVDAPAADAVFVVTDGRLSTATVTASTASVDRSRRLAEVRPDVPVSVVPDVGRVFDAGALATAAQILGAGAAVLDMATSYALARRQFGRPIGQFQAVKHQLADVLVGLELARPLLYGAALAFADGSATTARDVSAAKVACTAAAYRASRAALQVHGAIGYTAEYDLSLWLTKIRALVSAWGTQRAHRARVLAAI